MKKTRIEFKAGIVARDDAYKMARLITDNQRDMIINMADSNDKADINFANVDLVEFRVYTKTLLADSI